MRGRELMMVKSIQRNCASVIFCCSIWFRAFLSLCLGVSVVHSATAAAANGGPASQPSSFYRDVRPVLMANCNACHKPDKTKAELDMTSYSAVMKGGKHGKTVVPGKPEDSRLIEEISGDEPTM